MSPLYYFVLLLVSAVLLNVGLAREIHALSLPAPPLYSGETPTGAVTDHLFRHELHNHVDRQTLERVLQTVRADQPLAERRSLKKVHHSARKLTTDQQLYHLPLV